MKDIKKVYDAAVIKATAPDGTLNPNAVLPEIFNKISTQRTVTTFNFKHNLVQRYLKNTNLYGDKDELVMRKFENLQQDWKDTEGEWIKYKKLVKAISVWIKRAYDDQYPYTLTDVMAQAAFKNAATFGNIVAEMRNMVYDSKHVTWYNRIIDIYENGYQNVITVPRDLKGAELQKYVIKLLKDMTFVSKNYNVAKVDDNEANTTAYTLDDLQVTWNVDRQVDFQTDVSLNFNSMEVNLLKTVYNSPFAKFTEKGKDIIMVIDTPDTIHVGLETSYASFQYFAQDRYTNYFLNEMYKVGINPFTLGVVLKYESDAKALSDDITTLELGKIADKQEATILAAVKAKNTNAVVADITVSAITDTTATLKGKGEYTGTVKVSYTIASAKTK
jgi:hypothetical protein